MGYLAPVDAPISSSWQDHKDRNPPSAEPGTDYACAYGTAILAAGPGVVADRQTSPSGGTGRYVAVDLDDGRRVRYLHLSSVTVGVGKRVNRGTKVGISGASGYGDDWYYGPHVHVTLFPHHAYDFDSTLDFATYVGGDDPKPPKPPKDEDEGEDMIRGLQYVRESDGHTIRLTFDSVSGWWSEYDGAGGDYTNDIAKFWDTGSWPMLTEWHAAAIKRDLDRTRNRAVDLTDIPPTSRSARVGWAAFVVLAALGLIAGVWFDVLIPR